jgi:hypothetical protein
MEMTLDELRRYMTYDPETGVFVRTGLVKTSKRAGSVVGRIDQKGYRVTMIRYHYYLLHRVAWLFHYGQWPPADIDHINGDRADNRISNLRLATRKENSRNRKLHYTNTSGFRGVTWDRSKMRWKAKITVNGKSRTLGNYVDIADAAAAYEKAAAVHYGEFRRDEK